MLKSSTIINEEKIKNIHPGAVLKEEFLTPLNITEKELSKAIYLDEEYVKGLINCKSPITVDVALRLSKYFGTTAKFWLNLQNSYDIEELSNNKLVNLDFIKPYKVE